MHPHEIASVYQRILGERFPGVLVCPDPDIQPSQGIILGVFCLPDGSKLPYTRFITEEFDDLLASENAPRVTLLPHSISVTRTHYPGIWALAQSRTPTVRYSSGPTSKDFTVLARGSGEISFGMCHAALGVPVADGITRRAESGGIGAPKTQLPGAANIELRVAYA